MRRQMTAAVFGLSLPFGLCFTAAAQPFSNSAGWGTIGVLQTENPAVCGFFNQFGWYQFAGGSVGSYPVPVRASYPAHLVGSAAFYTINYSTPDAGASVQFRSDGTASVLLAGSTADTGSNPSPVVTYAVGTFTGGVSQEGGLEWTNIVFNYTVGPGYVCSAQLYGTFFSTPYGG